MITFSNGNTWITNNRCERGEILGDAKDQAVKNLVKEATLKKEQIPDLYKLREKLLFADYLPEEEYTEHNHWNPKGSEFLGNHAILDYILEKTWIWREDFLSRKPSDV